MRALPKPALIGAGVALVALIAIGLNAVFSTSSVSTASGAQTPQVQVASVSSLTNASGPLEVTGTVTSLSHANILAQTSGELVSLSHQLGDQVAAGDVIGQFENSSQRASVQQAQGAYDAAVAALELASNTTAVNSGVTSGSAQQTLQNAQTSLETALSSAYAALDDAVHTRADLLFTNARTSSPTIALSVPDSVLVNQLQQERSGLDSQLADAHTVSVSASTSNLDSAASTMILHAQAVARFISGLIRAVNETPPSQSASAATLAGYQTSLAAAQSEVLSAISSVTAAKGAYDNAAAGAITAQNAATGGTQGSLAVAQANVDSALGALNAAKANLEKTIVRSPISGTIVSLPVSQGDFVSAFSPVASVSNPSALYVDTTVTPEDAKTLSIGNAAVINGAVQGKVTFIASAIGPNASGIEVKVGITGNASTLTDGAVVSLSLNRSETVPTASPGMKSAYPTIPINAANIQPTGAVVFTVSASSTLVAHPVTLGAILGDHVAVTNGLSGTEAIVTDARGLSAGETVAVSTSSPL